MNMTTITENTLRLEINGKEYPVEHIVESGEEDDIFRIRLGFSRTDYEAGFSGELDLVREGEIEPWRIDAYLVNDYAQSAHDVALIARELLAAADLADALNHVTTSRSSFV